MTSYVYSFRDAQGALLYVGATEGDPQARIALHRDAHDWFDDVADVTIDEYPNALAAATAERQMLIDERPMYNIDAPIDRGDTVYTPLYSTREYAERLGAALAGGTELPVPHGPGQALVFADVMCRLDHGSVTVAALNELAKGYRTEAQITWRWDPSAREFR